MSKFAYRKVYNFAWYQGLWFTAVLGGQSVEWILLALLGLHLATVGNLRSELLLMIGIAAMGASFDSLLATAGYFAFEDAGPVLPIPLWLIAIWLAFAGTLRHSMAFMVGHPRLMTIAAAGFAPLTYLAAQRLGAVTFPLGNLPTAIVIGLAWFALTPAMIALARAADGNLPELFSGQLQQKEQFA